MILDLKKNAFGLTENASNVQKWICDELCAITSEPDNLNTTTASANINAHKQEQSNSLWQQFDSKVLQVKTTITPSVMSTLMLRQYLDIPHLERTKNPLEYWQQYKQTFPEMYKLSLKYLSIPATSVPSERVFSITGQITNDRRNRLSPKNLDIIIFLNSNLNIF